MKAIITGVNGQDGSYLSELLLSKGYDVIGLVRRSSTDGTERIKHLLSNQAFELVEADVTDNVCMNDLIIHNQPDELYNLAAQSHVATSFKQPLLTWRVNAEGVINILEAIKNYSRHTRFYQASTSEMFGSNFEDVGSAIPWQDENTAFSPQSPYAIAKVAAHQAVGLYRQAYGLHASCGILFNHESERRGEQFVTRKITRWLGRYLAGLETNKLKLGDVRPRRDWGHAEDYVEAMYLMLQQDKADDYVVATGKTYMVNDFLKLAFQHAGLYNDIDDLVELDINLCRPAEVSYLRGMPTKAQTKLGWKPKTDFNTLVSRMVEADIRYAEEEARSQKISA